MACHWVRDKEVPGGKYWVPECWGGLYDAHGCYCTRDAMPKSKFDQIMERIDKLEARLSAHEKRGS